MNKIKIITCEKEDWEICKLDGKVFSGGYKITRENWLELFLETNKVKLIEVSYDVYEIKDF